MCIRDRPKGAAGHKNSAENQGCHQSEKQYFEQGDDKYCTDCLLYTSDAADERSSVDLGGRRIIKKNNQVNQYCHLHLNNSQQRWTTTEVEKQT